MAGRLTIERSEALYRLPAGHREPAAARRRLDRVIAEEVPRVLGSLLDDVLAAEDPSVWVIRSLDAELTCDLAVVDDRRLGTALAAAVGRSLLTTIKEGPDGDAVLRYRDRAAYLAAFLSDLAAGRAWQCWQYASFDALRSLPASTAVAEALLRERAQIAPVFARLVEDRTLESVLTMMTEPAAARLVAAFFGETAGCVVGADIGLARLFVSKRSAPGVAATPARNRLRLLARVMKEEPTLLASPRLAPSLALASLWIELGAQAADLVEVLATGFEQAVRVLDRLGLPQWAAALPALRDIARRQPDAMRELAAGVARREDGALDGDGVRRFDSPSAAVFFLLPSYLALGVEAVWSGLAADGLLTDAERPLLRHQVVAKAMGYDPASPPDEVLRLVCALAPPDSAGRYPSPAHAEAVAAVLATLAAAAADALPGEPAACDLDQATTAIACRLLRHFARRLPGFGRASDAHLIANFLTGTGRVRVTPDTIDVDLPPLPLAVVARMAGADGLTYDLPWLGRTVTVHCAAG